MNDLKEIGGFIVSADPFVQHDNSLSGNGTVNSPLGVVPGYNETVLWSGTFTTASSGIPLSEAADNFEKLKFEHHWNGNGTWENWVETIIPVKNNTNNITLSNITQISTANNNGAVYYTTNVIKFDTTAHNKFVHIAGFRSNFANANTSTTDITIITKVIGINRKQ